mmetsp:Transcript_4979/g.8749  ORF Transcript_4979/g.8749 Transcript_4979/m.8749 type:complete len:216 (+) Transcript_4979:747-1394(+)
MAFGCLFALVGKLPRKECVVHLVIPRQTSLVGLRKLGPELHLKLLVLLEDDPCQRATWHATLGWCRLALLLRGEVQVERLCEYMCGEDLPHLTIGASKQCLVRRVQRAATNWTGIACKPAHWPPQRLCHILSIHLPAALKAQDASILSTGRDIQPLTQPCQQRHAPTGAHVNCSASEVLLQPHHSMHEVLDEVFRLMPAAKHHGGCGLFREVLMF